MIIAAPALAQASDVARLLRLQFRRQRAIVDQNVLLSSEGDHHASRGLGIDFTAQRGLASSNGGLLLGAVTVPVQKHLIGVDDSVELSRETKSDQNADGLFEVLREHVDLRGSWAGDAACVVKSRRFKAAGRKFVKRDASRQEVPA